MNANILPKPFTREGLLDMLEVSASQLINEPTTHPLDAETSHAPQSYPMTDSCTSQSYPTTNEHIQARSQRARQHPEKRRRPSSTLRHQLRARDPQQRSSTHG